MPKLSHTEVEHVAELAKLGLTDEERDQFGHQLSEILEYAEILQKLDTSSIPPTAQVIDLRSVMRLDTVAPSLSQDEALANAPAKMEGSFKVQPILEE
jgi:aspartyl-tRNA(Asn)/glutamyl-tRNA(Gln) amidotransferase subunit C